jgi:hypothetical protein
MITLRTKRFQEKVLVKTQNPELGREVVLNRKAPLADSSAVTPDVFVV